VPLGLTTALGRDAFVMLSGGDSPFQNNYSQYLQARAMVAFFQKTYPPGSVWVFFGAGNVERQKPVFCDVRRQIKRGESLFVDTWLPGSLPGNRPAKKNIFLKALREEILPAVKDGGTLFLFVGDHGSRTRGAPRESIISLWSMDPAPTSEYGWRSNDSETLSVSELRAVLAEGLGKGKVVFCMTQCHAGGFHYLGIPREVRGNPDWFKVAPSSPPAAVSESFPLVAGFAATDERSMAAGCDPAPDPESWAGYERFLPEKLLGIDLFTSRTKGKRLRSFAEAHGPATLVDETIDKPCSTSEYYLERWAAFIEGHLTTETNLTERIGSNVAIFQATVDGATPRNGDKAFIEHQRLFAQFTQKLAEQCPSARELILHGTRKELEAAAGPGGRRARRASQADAENQKTRPEQPRRRREERAQELEKLWTKTIRPAWEVTIQNLGQKEFSPATADFEKHLLGREARGKDFLSSDESDIDEEVFWFAGYHKPSSLKPKRAEEIAIWAAERRDFILSWAAESRDTSIRSAAARIMQLEDRQLSPGNTNPSPDENEPRHMTKRTAAQRVLFYRRVLAAWQFLLNTEEIPALQRLAAIIDLEQTPLPQPTKTKAARSRR
jgi:hypothetical protein